MKTDTQRNPLEKGTTMSFNARSVTVDQLKDLTISQLLMVYNAHSVTQLKAFRDHKTAVARCTAVLKNDAKAAPKAPKAAKEPKAPKAPKAPKEPKAPKADGPPPKCERAREVKRETKGMLRTIKIVKDHPGQGLRAKRWDRYKDGMTLKHVIETPGLYRRDVMLWVEAGLMKLVDPS